MTDEQVKTVAVMAAYILTAVRDEPNTLRAASVAARFIYRQVVEPLEKRLKYSIVGYMEEVVHCEDCVWTGTRAEAVYGKDDYCCPNCGRGGVIT